MKKIIELGEQIIIFQVLLKVHIIIKKQKVGISAFYYRIKLFSEELKKLYNREDEKNPLTWLEFNKYSEKLVENYYVYLMDNDLLCLKMLYDLSNRKLGEIVNIKNRKLKGNISQKLYVNINIKNPIMINLDISSIKLNCDFYPNKKNSDLNSNQSHLIYLQYSLFLPQ